MEVYHDARVYDTGMVCVIEIMGRHAGWLTAAAGLATAFGAGPDLIYMPETDFDMDKFMADVERVYKEKGNCMVAVSEGIHYADGSFVSEAKTCLLYTSPPSGSPRQPTGPCEAEKRKERG